MIPTLQDQEVIYLVYIGVALGAFLLVTGLGQLLSRGENDFEARNRRMRMIRQGASTEEVLALLKPPEEAALLKRIPLIGTLSRDMRRAGMTASPARFALFCLLGGLVLGLAAIRILPPFQAIALGLSTAFVLPLAIVRTRRAQRVEKLVGQLPDALDSTLR